MLVLSILLGTLLAGVGSVWLAAAISFGWLSRYTQHMLSLAAGALLATAFLHLLPEAFESQIEAHTLFFILLAGLVFFFLLDKAELWHHGHEHHHPDPHAHAHAHTSADPSSHVPHPDHSDPAPHAHSSGGSWAILTGDAVHCFGDGILIASAFMADLRLGAVAALAVLVHEIPHHIGDLIVLRNAAGTNNSALIKVTMAGAFTALGGLVGFWLVEQLRDYIAYFLVLASSSFVYVALADLIPQLQKRLSARHTAAQVAWLLVGIGLVWGISVTAHLH
jgi:zinc and cadmium transporter